MTMPFELEIEIEFAVQVVVHLAELNPPYQKGNTRGVKSVWQPKPRDRNLEIETWKVRPPDRLLRPDLLYLSLHGGSLLDDFSHLP
jgi:hypothetical protein